MTIKQEKNKTTIIVPRRLRKAELEKVIDYLSISKPRQKKVITKKQIQQLADEITKNAWEKLKQKRGFKWS